MERFSPLELDVLTSLFAEVIKFLSDSSDIECCLRCVVTKFRPMSVESLTNWVKFESADWAKVPTTGISTEFSLSVSVSLLLCSSSSVLHSSEVRLSVEFFDSFKLSSLLLSSRRERILNEEDVAGVKGLGVALVNGKRLCKCIDTNELAKKKNKKK